MLSYRMAELPVNNVKKTSWGNTDRESEIEAAERFG